MTNNKQPYIFLTGASSGIGKEMAISLSNDYPIILHGRDKERLLDTFSQCSKKYEHQMFIADLSLLDELEGLLIALIKENDLEVSGFIHCAGYMKMLPLKSVTVSEIFNTFSVNVFAAEVIMKVLSKKMVNKNHLKSAIFISSNISNFGAKAFSVYSASKSGLDGLMRSLAIELAPNIRVNSVLPGAILTEMTKSIFENKEVKERMETEYPLGIGTPNDIYQMVNFLLSDKACWITGQQFTIDGGRTINISS